MSEAPLVDRVRTRLLADSRTQGKVHVPAADLAELVRAESTLLADDVALRALARDVEASLSGAGPLDELLALPGVTDVLVNGADRVWIDRGHGLELTSVQFDDDFAVRQLAQRLATAAGRRLDDASPFVDSRLADGTRLHAVLPPVSARPCLSLRVLGRSGQPLASLVPAGALPLLYAIVQARMSFVISGTTGSGKTTLLAAMLANVVPTERILVIEDAAELVVTHPHVIGLQSRTSNVEGAGVVELRDLVRQSLRMRPDRIIVGEFRGAEMLELLLALNTGHDGSAATLHANSANDVPARLAALAALSGVGAAAIVTQVAAAFDVVIHLSRRGSRRLVESIALLDKVGTELVVRPIWVNDSAVGSDDVACVEFVGRLRQRGVQLAAPA